MKRPRPYWREVRSKKQSEPNHDIFEKFLLNPAVIIAVLTAALYFHGHAFCFGYLNYWGLNTQIFPLLFEETLTEGAWSYLLLGIDKWKYLAGLVGFFLLLYGLLFLLMYKKPQTFLRKLFKTKRINDQQRVVLNEAADRVFQLSLLLLIVFTIILISLWSVQKGKSLAEEKHRMIHSTTEAPKPFTIVTIDYLSDQDAPITVSGTLLQSSSTMFALHSDSDDVLVIPASRLISIRYHGENNPKQKKGSSP